MRAISCSSGVVQARTVQSQPELWQQCTAQLAAQIDGLLQRRTVWREVGYGLERLFPGFHGGPVSKPAKRLGPCLPVVGEGFVPHLAAQGVLRQTVHLLGQPVWEARFQDFDNVGV